jgi:hypothetical protein
MSYPQRRRFLAAAAARPTLLDREPAEAGRSSIRSGNKATTWIAAPMSRDCRGVPHLACAPPPNDPGSENRAEIVATRGSSRLIRPIIAARTTVASRLRWLPGRLQIRSRNRRRITATRDLSTGERTRPAHRASGNIRADGDEPRPVVPEASLCAGSRRSCGTPQARETCIHRYLNTS